MDVLKDFELRQVGSRLVLRQICPPDFEMRTIIAADKIVEQKEDFFVLGYNEKFFCLCRYDKQNRCLCSKIGCDDYVRLGKKILFLQNMMWQLWDEDFQLHFLGESVDQKKTVFVRKLFEGKTWNGLYLLSYFEGNRLCQVRCSDYQKTEGKSIPCLQADIAKFKIEGVWRFLNIFSRRKWCHCPGMKAPEYGVEQKVVLSENLMASWADYHHFVETFQSSKSGFGWIADFEEKFADALWEGKDPFFDVVLLPLFGSCGESFGVEVIARMRRIFEGETQGIYQVLAKDVFYKQDADEVEMGQFDGKDCLYVRYGNKVHKFVYKPKVIGAKLQLIE